MDTAQQMAPLYYNLCKSEICLVPCISVLIVFAYEFIQLKKQKWKQQPNIMDVLSLR